MKEQDPELIFACINPESVAILKILSGKCAAI